MRVLFVTHSFPRHPGDVAGAFVLRLARALRARGGEVRVLAPSAAGLDRSTVMDGVPVERFRYAPRAWETLAYAGTMAEQVGASWRAKLALAGLILGGRRAIRATVRDFRPDVIHAHWWFPSGLAAALAHPRSPTVVTLHGSDVRLAARSALAPKLMRFACRRAAAVTAVSTWLASEAQRIAAVNVAAIAPMPVEDAAPGTSAPRTKSVLFVGRLNEQKGARDVLDALRLLPGDVTADFVGDGGLRAELEAAAASAGMERRIRWHGQLPPSEVATRYRSAGAVVVPSREEGLGLVAVEAQIAGTPVVAYASGGLPDIVENLISGLLVEPGNVAALAEAIGRVLNDGALAATLAAGGRERAAARFSPAAAAAAYEAVYRRVAS
ncbi:MAG: glycosyltransferase [Gemmatimonadaceae bacterium]|nr:glycosyltransferase [Gemmatimonadaceae bacterium]